LQITNQGLGGFLETYQIFRTIIGGGK
jgi:hypothetical protein